MVSTIIIQKEVTKDQSLYLYMCVVCACMFQLPPSNKHHVCCDVFIIHMCIICLPLPTIMQLTNTQKSTSNTFIHFIMSIVTKKSQRPVLISPICSSPIKYTRRNHNWRPLWLPINTVLVTSNDKHTKILGNLSYNWKVRIYKKDFPADLDM